MQNMYTHALQHAILNWPSIKTGRSCKMCLDWDDEYLKSCYEQLALYAQGKWRLQTNN